jgi:hypothetical protein
MAQVALAQQVEAKEESNQDQEMQLQHRQIVVRAVAAVLMALETAVMADQEL